MTAAGDVGVTVAVERNSPLLPVLAGGDACGASVLFVAPSVRFHVCVIRVELRRIGPLRRVVRRLRTRCGESRAVATATPTSRSRLPQLARPTSGSTSVCLARGSTAKRGNGRRYGTPLKASCPSKTEVVRAHP